MARTRHNIRFGPSDLQTLLVSGGVQIVQGNDEFWIFATDKFKASVKVENAHEERVLQPDYGKKVKEGWGAKFRK